MSVKTEVRPGMANLACIQADNPSRFPFLLESAAQEGALNQFSVLFAYPQQRLECTSLGQAGQFFSELDAAWRECAVSCSGAAYDELPFTGGWFVYLGYEMAQGIEPTLALPGFQQDIPHAYAVRCPAAIIVDHHRQQTICMVEEGSQEHLASLVDSLQITTSLQAVSPRVVTITEDDNGAYKTGVEKILRYIEAGDVFQVNLSRQWCAESDADVASSVVYQQLCKANPAPFACLIHHQDGDIVSSSPERLVRVRKGVVETRPIAGTRPRVHTHEDEQWLKQLCEDAKERAEHIMLIDLERNDLGRVCDAGSIEVDELMVLESYEHVHHIVSNIRGTVKSDTTPVDILKAVFPGGTITGCPKVRCMEIIAELEQEGRGPYTGSVGYINHDGSMDFNILIRTLFIKGKQIHFRAGAGIVADSTAEFELKETRHKAKGLLLAIAPEQVND